MSEILHDVNIVRINYQDLNLVEDDEFENVIEKYYLTILKIKEKIPEKKENKIVGIQFEDDVEFIQPLFLIYLLNLINEVEKLPGKVILKIDLSNLKKKKCYKEGQSPYRNQNFVLIYLLQYIDYEKIVLEYNDDVYIKEADYFSFDNRVYLKYKGEKDYSYNTLSRVIDKNGNRVSYPFLPIVQITPLYNIDDTDGISLNNDESVNRASFYHSFKVTSSSQYIDEDYSEKIRTILDEIFILHLDVIKDKNANLARFIQNILCECIFNIVKHTNNANGYISFYKNKSAKRNEFLVCDNYEKGFLDTYLDVLITELKNILVVENEKVKKDSEYSRYILLCLENYNKDGSINEFIRNIEKLHYKDSNNEHQEFIDIVKDFSTEITALKNNTVTDDKNILNGLFHLKTSIGMHQARRITMHFGIPVLLNILNKLISAKLEIYVHRNNRCYVISYDSEGETNIEPIELATKSCVVGTYIKLSFPFTINVKKEFENEVNNKYLKEATPLNLKEADYKYFYKNKQNIQNQINKFKLLNLQKTTKKNQHIVIDYRKYFSKNKISDFLREVFNYTYISNTEDVIIKNFPIKLNQNYLQTISYILYPDNNEYYGSPLNIIFMDDTYPSVMFLGTKSREEAVKINQDLSMYYNYYGENFFPFSDTGNKEVSLKSELFYKNRFIPFELFFSLPNDESLESKEVNTKYIYTEMMENYLEINSKNIHVDTKKGFHLNKFYFFKNIFENSVWIYRLAFDLSRKFESFIKNDMLIVGFGKYSALIISIMKSILNLPNSVYIIDDFEHTGHFEEYLGNTVTSCMFFSPILLSGNGIKNFFNLDSVDSSSSLYYCAINLKYDNIDSNKSDFITLFEKKLNDACIHLDENCPHCFSDDYTDEKPLYEISLGGFNILDIYLDNIYNIEKSAVNNVSWRNSLHFGHVKRGNNHYLYYTKTLNFLDNNLSKVKRYFRKQKNIINTDKISVILSPNHHTNNSLITVINKVLFKNNAIIHPFSLKYKEQNLHQLGNLTFYNKRNYDFYFVDDEISSGNTLEYFSSLLHSIIGVSKFKGVFTLINRTSNEDAKIISNYYEKNNFFNFLKLNTKPIKTSFEDCYLCNREKSLKGLMKDSSMVFLKNEFKKRVEKLQVENNDFIENDTIDLVRDFNNFLKLFAVEFIYSSIEKFGDIDTIKECHQFVASEVKNFCAEVKKYFYEYYYKKYNYEIENDLNNTISKMIEFEASIAYIKALSFPKILYYHNIRRYAQKYITFELKNYVEEYRVLSSDDILEPVKILTDNEINLLRRIPELSSFGNSYNKKKKTEIDMLNFLFTTAGYLNINYILDYDIIKFYYRICKTNEENPILDLDLTKYPVSVKMITSYSKAKSKIFNKNIKRIRGIDFTGEYSRIISLWIENNNLKNNSDFLKRKAPVKINDKLALLKSELLKLINIPSENIFMYVDLLQNPKKNRLVNIFNKQIKTLNNKSNRTSYILYKGAQRDKSLNYKERIKLKPLEDEHNFDIWCNYYESLKNNKGRHYIRISNVRETLNKKLKKEISFQPIVLIVINTEDRIGLHLDIASKIFSVQAEIIDFIETQKIIPIIREKEREQFSSQLALDTSQLALEKEQNENKTKLIKGSHGAAGDINNALININDGKELFINVWKAYCNTYIGNMYLDETKRKHNILETRDCLLVNIKDLLKYIEYLNEVRSVNILFKISNEDIEKLEIKNNYIKIIFSLFIDNAIRHSDIYPNIKIYYENDMYIIENDNILDTNVDCIEINERLKIEPYKISENQGITLFTINKYLEDVNCFLETEYENDKFKVLIKKREGKNVK